MASELVLVITGGFAGGLIRGIVGILKAWRNGRKIRKKYFTATLLASAAFLAGTEERCDLSFCI